MQVKNAPTYIPVTPKFREQKPQSECWEVQKEAYSSTAALLEGHDFSSQGVPAVYHSVNHRKAFEHPGEFITGPLAGGVMGGVLGGFAGVAVLLAQLPSGYHGDLVTPVLQSFIGVGAAAGLALAVGRNLPSTRQEHLQGVLSGPGEEPTFKTTDSRQQQALRNFHNDPGPFDSEDIPDVGQMERLQYRSIPLNDYAKAPVVTGDPLDAPQWWNGRFGGE